MKTIGIALLLATSLSACQPRHDPPVADAVKVADATPVVRDEPKQFSPCGTHDEIVARAKADGMTLNEGATEGGGTGTSSIVETFDDGARKSIKVLHGPDHDCFIDPEADSNGTE